MGIEFVIVIVLAVLILSLGIVFIKNMFDDVNKLQKSVIGDADINKLKDQLQKDTGQSCILSTLSETTANRDATNQFSVLISNPDPTAFCYQLGKSSFQSVGDTKLVEGAIADNKDYDVNIVDRTWVLGKEVKTLQVLMDINPSVQPGKYLFNFVLKRYKKGAKLPSDKTIDATVCEDASAGTFSGGDTVCTKNFALNIK